MKRFPLLLAAVLLLSGCGGVSVSQKAASPEVTEGSTPTPAVTPTVTPTVTPAVTPTVTPTASSSPTPLPETVSAESAAQCSAGCLELLERYRDDDAVRHILTVTGDGGSHAVARYFEKVPDGETVWTPVLVSDACVGINGMGKTAEGDGKTPMGEFGILSAFGICPDPGTVFPYTPVTETTYACDEPGEYYNRIIDTAITGHACTGEPMYCCSPDYRYGLVPDFNAEGIYPNGSGIFIHCKGSVPYTYGCVALDEQDMLTILQTADTGLRLLLE